MCIYIYVYVFCLLQNNIHRFLQNSRCLSRNSIDDLIKISDRKKIASRFIKQQICAGQRCFTTEIKFLAANVSRIIRMNTFKVHGPARERSVHVYVTKNVKRGRNLDSPVSSMAVSVEEWKAGEENFRTETAPRLDRRRWKRQIAPRQECHMYFRKSRRSKSGYAKVHLEGTN